MSDEPQVGKTKQGKTVVTSPGVSSPSVGHTMYGRYGTWLGSPETRYGKLRSARHLPDWVKIEMLADPVIGWCLSFIASALIDADRVIECADPQKRQFFEDMFRAWEKDFMAQAAMSICLGHLGLIKKWAFEVPQPVESDAEPAWPWAAKPFVITGFDPVYPVGSSPRFDRERKHFNGMTVQSQNVDVFYSLWLTSGKAWAFGDYQGRGRLEGVYLDWWMKRFGRDAYTVRMIKSNDPAVVAFYPPGQTDGGKDHRDIALELGDSVRGLATIALPSTVYKQTSMTGEVSHTSVREWDVEYLEASIRGPADWIQFEGHINTQLALGMFIPPQAFLQVKQPELGGRTTADVLLNAAIKILMMDATGVDQHLTLYAFAPVDVLNFPPDSPPVRVRTVGIAPDTKVQLFELIKSLLARPDVSPGEVDVQEALNRLGFPTPDRDGGLSGIGAAAVGDDDEVPDDVLRQMLQERITPPEPGPVPISDKEIDRVFRKLKETFPELFQD